MRKAKQQPAPSNPIADPYAGRLVIRLPEAFGLLGIGKSLGYKLIKRDELKTVKLGSRTLAHVQSIREPLGHHSAQ